MFASEDAAFTAAEEVYRAYNDALNKVDPSDPSTFEPVYALSSGSARKADRENLSRMHAEGHRISGSAVVLSFQGTSSEPPFTAVSAIACLDVSAVHIADSEGNSLVNPDRPNVYAILITFLDRDGRLVVDESQRAEDSTCAQ